MDGLAKKTVCWWIARRLARAVVDAAASYILEFLEFLTARKGWTLVRTERGFDYAVAAASLGTGHTRLLARQLLLAARGFIGV